MDAKSPFTHEQTKFLLDLLQGFRDTDRTLAALQHDLARDFIVLTEALIDKSLVTDEDLCARLEKAKDNLMAVQIAMQNKPFFDELRERVDGKE